MEIKKTNNDLTELVFILDRSGSMSGLEADTIGGFNSMVEKQKKESGRALVSTVLFNQESMVVHDRKDVRQIEPLTEKTYCVGGCTALLDAVGDAVHHIRNVHKYIRPEDVPAHTMFVITTDGFENASRRYSVQQVRTLVKAQEQAGWEFLFLGANIDAVETAKNIGIREERAVDYCCDSKGTALNFRVLADCVSSVRRGKGISEDWCDAICADYEERG
ncbi:MAG: VWA domain-containing protein [Clostridia bacterium]|nr:VWA domain-containing protein [Clostridia bacterium]